VSPPVLTQDSFTTEEVRKLEPFFTNTDQPVFALRNLPETVKGALFARYSRSAKSLRRLFLDEFAKELTTSEIGQGTGVGAERAERLYARVLNEYGDDSVAQLGSAHVACEGVSNVLTKVLEWGRLMAYLEQSTRYVPYTDKLHGRWRYHVPAEIEGSLRERYIGVMDSAFATYASLIEGSDGNLYGSTLNGGQADGGIRRGLGQGLHERGHLHAFLVPEPQEIARHRENRGARRRAAFDTARRMRNLR